MRSSILLYARRQGVPHIGRLAYWRYAQQYREAYHFMSSCLDADPLLDLLDLVPIYDACYGKGEPLFSEPPRLRSSVPRTKNWFGGKQKCYPPKNHMA